MKKTRLFSIIAAISWFLLSGSVQTWAGHRTEVLTLSPTAGVYLFDNDQDWDDALAYGLSLGFNYTKNWGTEFTLNYARTEDDEKVLDDIDVGIFRWDVLYHFFPECTVVPYLAVGMGGLYADPENGDDDLDLMTDWGGGLKYYITDNLALRVDARHIFEVEDDFQNFLFSGGLMFQFGR